MLLCLFVYHQQMNGIIDRKEREVKETQDIWTKNYSISHMFYWGEIKRILKCFIGIVLCISYLVFVAKQSMMYFLIPLGVFLLALLAMGLIGTRKFRKTFEEFSDFRKEKIEMDFRQPHPVHSLFTGEAHLLPDCMICRSGGRLFLILTEEIVKVRNMQYSKSYGLARSLLIWTDTNQKYQIEFAGKHKKEIKEVIAWITEKNPHVIVEQR